MLVKDIMRSNVETCRLDDNLESVALRMWNHDCGVIPVVDENYHPVGMITDRDIAMGCSLNHKPLWEMNARDILNHRPLFSCDGEENVTTLLEMMNEHQIRRIPVTNGDGQLAGIVSIGDTINVAKKGNRSANGLGYDKVMNALKGISNPEHFDHELVMAS